MSLDDLQAQLRGAIEQQFTALKQHHEQALAEAGRQAVADAEREAAARLETARAEWDSSVATKIEAAKAEARQQAEETARAQRQKLEQQLNEQLEQSVQHAMNSVRKASELEIEALRRRVEEDVQAERTRGETALQAAVEAERAKVQEAVDAKVQETVAAKVQETIDAERQRGQQEFDAERQRLQQEANAERQRLQQADAERQRIQQEFDGERQRLQQELEAERQRLQQEAESQPKRLQEAIAAERARAKQDLEEERARAKTELETVQQLMEAELASAQAEATAAHEAAARAAVEMQVVAAAATPAAPVASTASADPGALARVPQAVRALDAARSLGQTLEGLLQQAAGISGRAALFLIDGDRLKPWKTVAIPEVDVQTVDGRIQANDLLGRAINTGQMARTTAELPAPGFARLKADRPALAVPLMVAGRAVAALYADAGETEPAGDWGEAVDLVARHASAVAAMQTASRTLEILRADAPGAATESNGGNGEEGARRYARLLVSEIKLYNEAAVRAGRQQRDLRERLRSEIDRAQRLYEERIPAAVGARDQFFHQELVQTLADGDATLLGS